MTTQSPTCFIYLRVSTARQAKEGIGLDAQEAKSRAHAERMGWKVLEIFKDEGISGKDGIENRPGLKALIAAAKANSDAVTVVYSVSRLARRQRLLWQLLDEREGEGLAISSATESFDTSTPMGRAMLGMIGVWSQLEADMISERTRDALAEAKAQGRKLGQKSMKELAPETVELVKNLYASGNFTLRSLADHLNQQGTPSPAGGKWWPRSVEKAVKA